MARFVNLLGLAGFISVCGLEHENLREMDLWYVLVIHKLKNRSRNINPVYKELRACKRTPIEFMQRNKSFNQVWNAKHAKNILTLSGSIGDIADGCLIFEIVLENDLKNILQNVSRTVHLILYPP